MRDVKAVTRTPPRLAHHAGMNPAEESPGRAVPPSEFAWDPYNVQVVTAAAVLTSASPNMTVPLHTDTNPRCQVWMPRRGYWEACR